MSTRDLSVVDHLHELRKRIIVCLVSVAMASIIIYSKVSILITILMMPIAKFKIDLVYFTLFEGFMTRIEVSVYAGVIVMSPVILYEILAFINPGLSQTEKKFLYRNSVVACILFILGVAFGFILLLPHTLSFLISFATSYLAPIMSGGKYFNFIGVFCLATGVTFLIPHIIILLGKASLISFKTLNRRRIQVILTTLVVIGIVIPSADVFTVLTAAAPILLLYEISLWIVYFGERRKSIKKIKEAKKCA